MYGLQKLISTKCKPSDHSILPCSLQAMQSSLYAREEHPAAYSDKKYRFNNILKDFMNIQIWQLTVNNLIDVCTATRKQEDEIESIYISKIL